MTASGDMLQLGQPYPSPMGTFTAFARQAPSGASTEIIIRIQDGQGNEAWMSLLDAVMSAAALTEVLRTVETRLELAEVVRARREASKRN